MESKPTIDLRSVSSEDLRAELARRSNAARAKGKLMRYATKANWAEAKATELRAALADVKADYKPGSTGLRKKSASQAALEGEIAKFDRLAASYRRKGE